MGTNEVLLNAKINKKANKAIGTDVALTLQNGWTGNLYVRKNELNQVQVHGYITPGNKTSGAVIASIPNGYFNTSETTYINTGSTNTALMFYISRTTGNMGIEVTVPEAVPSISINYLYQI